MDIQPITAQIASEDSPKLTRADVLVEDGKISAYRVNMKVTFILAD